jgi:hypothetical protein
MSRVLESASYPASMPDMVSPIESTAKAIALFCIAIAEACAYLLKYLEQDT